VLDIIETFVKKQPTSPLILRLILPLLEIILNSGPTELHLSSKATGILNRLCSSKETPSVVDREDAVEILGELHRAARKAQSAAVAKTCSQCSLFVSRALLHDESNAEEARKAVVEAYGTSLEDFMTKKSTKVKASLFTDFASRFAVVAWGMRESLLAYAKSDGANSFRQAQAFHILDALVSQIPALVSNLFFPSCTAPSSLSLSSGCHLTGFRIHLSTVIPPSVQSRSRR
jgi:DNA polymerase phi